VKKAFESTDLDGTLTQTALKLLFLINEGAMGNFDSHEVWCVRGIIKLMASQKSQTKRIAYMLAPIVFQRSTQNEEIS
jgi:hypothetical protein